MCSSNLTIKEIKQYIKPLDIASLVLLIDP